MGLTKGRPIRPSQSSSPSPTDSDSDIQAEVYVVERLLDYKIRRVPNRRNDPANDDAYDPKLGKVKFQLIFLVK